ncbi:MAG: hypothetical protein PHT59_04205 [Candidatus Omnitrophica bacterium]|nr:hypothetical protein [Candidatus Omnitrophota bacterium]
MGRPRKVDFPDTEIADDPDETAELAPDALDQIQTLLKTVSPGYRIQVWRQAPREFRGLLEEIEVTDGQTPLDLQYLARTWGGKELRIKIRNKKGQYKGTYDIPLYSHPPLFWGRPIPAYTPPSYPSEQTSMQFAPPPVPAQSFAGNNLAELLQVLQKYKSTESELLSSLLNRTAAPPPTVQQPSPFEALNQAIELITRLQALTPAPPPPAPVSFQGGETDADSLVPHITRLIEMFLTRQERTAPPPPRTARPAPATPATTAPLNGKDILQSLAQADPKDLAGVYRGVLAELPRNQRLAAIEAFENAFESVEPDLFKDDEEDQTEESEKPGIG